jgi:DNA polymerase III alpha subunit
MPTSLPEDFYNICHIPEDPLLTLPPLPTSPPDFVPGQHLTEERLEALELNKFDFLWLEELKLLQHVLILNETRLAWTNEE